jgi:nucleotide-binding universal stress UspA family protein
VDYKLSIDLTIFKEAPPMISIKKILCPVDFFPASDSAVSYAVGLAANYEAKIHLLHVITSVLPGTYEYALDMAGIVSRAAESAAEEMKKLVARTNESGAIAESEVRVGDVYDEIKRSIEVVKPELIVMGTHGRRGVERWFIGSTTEKLLRHSPVPILTISATGERPLSSPQFRRILVTTDFSAGTAEALAYAFSLAQENQSQVTLLHVAYRIINNVVVDLSGSYREPSVKEVTKQLDDLVPTEARNWCDIVTLVEAGIPYRIILDMIEDEKVDLVVMNIHGKGMLDRALLGSTAERVVRAAKCPVMLIPPATTAQAGRKPEARAVRGAVSTSL